MEMHQIRYFLALSRTLNFTRAAEECNVTQPTLTRAVQKLEDELGGPLFNRERNLTHLTELGRLMLPHLEQTYAAANAAKDLAKSFKRLDIAPLSLGVSSTLDGNIVMPLVAELNRKIAGFEFALTSAPAKDTVETIMQGALDVVLIRDAVELPDRMHRWRLYDEAYRVLMREDDALAVKDAVSVADFAEAVWIERTGDELGERIEAAMREREVQPRRRHRATQAGQIEDMVMAGLGIALVPERMRVCPGLVSRPLADVDLVSSVILSTVAGRRYAPALDAFIKLARARSWEPPLAAAA